MDIKGLLDVTCKTVANMIKGKTPEEIRKTFNIKNDFTPSEEEQVRKENEWCEEKWTVFLVYAENFGSLTEKNKPKQNCSLQNFYIQWLYFSLILRYFFFFFITFFLEPLKFRKSHDKVLVYWTFPEFQKNLLRITSYY